MQLSTLYLQKYTLLPFSSKIMFKIFFLNFLGYRCKVVHILLMYRSSHPEVFIGKGVLKISSKITGEHPCRSVISIKLLCNFIEIKFRHECSPVNLLYIFRTPFPKNTPGWLLLNVKHSHN